MRAILWTGIPFNVTVQDVPIPAITNPTDVRVRMTAAAICGTDLHTYHGIYGSSSPPWIMGHEGLGIIESVGSGVESLQVGDYVVIPDTLDPGPLNMALAESEANLGGSIGLGRDMGTEYLVVPHAENSLIPIPAAHTLTYSGFEAGDTVAVFSAGPVGLLSAYSALLRGASRVYVVDSVPARLERAESIGAIPISLNGTDGGPAAEILRREPDGETRAVDCVGYEAVNSTLDRQENTIIFDMVRVAAHRGGLGTIGVFAAPGESRGTPRAGDLPGLVQFPIVAFFEKGLTWGVGPVDPKVVAPELEELVTSGRANLDFTVSSLIGIEEAPEYYQRFDQHMETKVIIRFP
ncbi:GroES-like protein [Aspergillus insuetus]